MTPATLIAEYRDGPRLLEAELADVRDTDWDAIPIPGRWSLRQVLCHLADFETLNSDRMKRVLAEDNPPLPAADPDLFAAALHYGDRDPAEELQVIAAVRNQTARLLQALELEDFQRTGVHSEDGPLTLESLLERTVAHLPHHIRFIREKRDSLNVSGT